MERASTWSPVETGRECGTRREPSFLTMTLLSFPTTPSHVGYYTDLHLGRFSEKIVLQ
jgi:hypothetical protein